MIETDFSSISLKLRANEGKTNVFDPVRRKWLVLTPEEYVRQLLLMYLAKVMQYPLTLMAVEKTIRLGKQAKRFDIVIYNQAHKPWMLAECKSPDVPVSEKTLFQLLDYQQAIQCKYWLLTNGINTFCADARNMYNITWQSSLPAYDS